MSTETDHEFGALNTLLLVVILGLCILSAYLIKQNSFYYLPESAAAIVVGMFVGFLARMVYPSTEELNFLSFEPQMFFFLLLPPIIFEAGYSMKKRDFFANFWTISLYTVFGTIFSAFTIGYLIYVAGLMGLLKVDTSSPLEGLLFGALISAVDPVATLSIMGSAELNCDPLLYALVFGESVLNDAVAIVLFKTFMQFYESGAAFDASTIPSAMFNFTAMSLGSVFVGVITGLICSYLCKHTQMKKYPEYEISMLFLFAYGSYSLSESLELSGIMSLFFSAIILSHYNSYNLSATSQITAHNIFKSLAVLSEYFVFLYLGMGLFTGRFKQISYSMIVLCILFCLIGRVFNVFPLSFFANLFRSRPISLKMQSVMWFAGLRGAISFALSLNMPGERKEMYISTTLSIVIFTTIVCGGLTEPFMKQMDMRSNSDNNNSNSIGDNASNSNSNNDHLSDDHSLTTLSATDSFISNDKNNHMNNNGDAIQRKLATKSKNIISAFSITSNGKSVHEYEHVSTTDPENAEANTQLIESQNSSSSLNSNHGNNNSSSNSNNGGIILSRSLSRTLLQRLESEFMIKIFGGPPSNQDNDEDDSDMHYNNNNSS